MPSDNPKLAPIKLHPALIVVVSVLIVGGDTSLWPLELESNFQTVLEQLGRVLFLLGFAILFFAYLAMALAKTTIDPRKHTTKIVTKGLYGYSRNPIYLGWFVLLLGISFEKSDLFQILISIMMICLLHWAVVLKEEVYLCYKRTVRRWL